MSTPAQIEANRANSQSSTGPKTEEGKQKTSMNAVQHGFTGRQVLVSGPEEKEAYDTHCISYVEQYQPKTHEETDLIQQYADQHWTLHQISIQQMNVMTMLNVATANLMKSGSDFESLNASVAPFYKQINTLGTYELRRRRAAEATLAQFRALVEARQAELADAALACKVSKSQGKPFNPADFGFVHSVADIDAHIARQNARAEVKKAAAAPKG